MRDLIVLSIVMVSLNLTALSHSRSVNSSSQLRENIPNRISVMERNVPFTKSIIANYEIKQGEKLNIYNPSGSIKFVGWNKNYVKITAIKRVFVDSYDLAKIHMVLSTLKGLNIKTVNVSDDAQARIDYIINIPKNTSIGKVISRGNIRFKNLPDYVVTNIRRLANR